MYSFFKTKHITSDSNSVEIIDLTQGGKLEDDYTLPVDVKAELTIRNIRKDVTIKKAAILIKNWEKVHSVKNIRKEYRLRRWNKVNKLAAARIKVHFEEEIYRKLIRSYYNLKLYNECLLICTNLLDIEVNNLEALRFRGRCSKNLGLKEVTINSYEQILKLSPFDKDALIAQIRAYYNDSQFNKVIQIASILIENHPGNKEAQLFFARAKINLIDLDGSLPHLHILLEHNQKDDTVLSLISKVYLAKRNYKLAEKYLMRQYELNQDDDLTRRRLIQTYRRQKKWAEANLLLQIECRTFPDKFLNWENIIVVLFNLNKEIEAKNCIDNILDFMDNSLESYILAHRVSSSFMWDKTATDLLDEASIKWAGEKRFHEAVIKVSFEMGKLCQTWKHIKLAENLGNNNNIINIYKSKYFNLIKSLGTSISEIEKSIKNGREMLKSECAIRNIIREASKVKPDKIARTNKNILMVSSSLGRGGAERQVVSCLEGLSREKTISKINLYCYSLDVDQTQTYISEIRDIGVPISEYGSSPEWYENYSKKDELLLPWKEFLEQLPPKMKSNIEVLYNAFCLQKPDIIHAWQDQTNVDVAIAGLMAGVPGIVLFARSMRPDQKTIMHIRSKKYLRRTYQYLMKNSRTLLCQNSDAGALSYSEWLNLKTNKIEVIHNGVDLTSIIAASEGVNLKNELKCLGIPKNSQIIGSVFRIVDEKRPKLWVDSVAKLIKNNDKLHGIIVGGGGLFHTLEQYIKDRNLSGRIHLIGQSKQIKAWLECFDMFLLTSRIEGLPNVLIEAQSFGIPVISTEAGGAADTFINGVTGVLVKKGDEKLIPSIIETKLNDEKWILNAKSQASINAREKFSQSKMISRLMEIYNKSIR